MANTLVDVTLSQSWQETTPESISAGQDVLSARTQKRTKIYNKSTIDQLVVLGDRKEELTKRYFELLIKEGADTFFENLSGQQSLLHIEDHLVPIFVPDVCKNNSYICSPYGHYVKLPLELLFLINNRMAQFAAKIFFRGLGQVLQWSNIDRVVYVNHWLFSTDLYPQGFKEEHIKEITELLIKKYPDRAIAFRSINKETTPELLSGFKNLHYTPIASRQVYISKPNDPAVHNTRIIKSDLKLLRETPYEIVEGKKLEKNEIKSVLDLHIKFTINHHSELNPKITEKLLRTMIDQETLKIFALRKNGIIDGVVGYIEKDEIMTCPLFGFDIEHPEKTKIYRLLSTILFTEAKKNNKVFHQSAGASFYKTLRRSTPHIEYLYVYTKHLDKRGSIGWKTLQAIMNTLALPFMKKY